MIGGPNDTPDMLDYPPACRDSLEAACNEYAETVYRLRNENKQLRDALDQLVRFCEMMNMPMDELHTIAKARAVLMAGNS